MLVLLFVRAHRERNFLLYVHTLQELAPLFFLTGHVNYARWATVHARDMRRLPSSVEEEFLKGNWVVSKTTRRFSAMPVDQAHEQLNKELKDAGGIIGVTASQVATDRWALASPELSRYVTQFEEESGVDLTSSATTHHEEQASFHRRFSKHASDLRDVLQEGENPFSPSPSSTQLTTLDGRVCVDPEPAKAVLELEDMGSKLREEFVQGLSTGPKGVNTKISSTKVALFKGKSTRKPTASTISAKAYKQSTSLMGQLWISAQTRKGDVAEIFCHESEDTPPSLSDQGQLYSTQKSHLLQELVKLSEDNEDDDTTFPEVPMFDAIILDGGQFIHTLPPRENVPTFKDYVDLVFMPKIRGQLRDCSRLDLVWDTYIEGSLKGETRTFRGEGLRLLVKATAKVPKKWPEFLRHPQNKTELFHLLSSEIGQLVAVASASKGVYATSGTQVIHIGAGEGMSSCSHEEADTRLVVHLHDALKAGCVTILIKTGDTDVVAILLGQLHRLEHPEDIWIAFGSGKNERMLNLGVLGRALGPSMARAMPVFHALTGCDTVSAFRTRGKGRCMATWKKCPWVTEVFVNVADEPFQNVDTNSATFKQIEKFVCVLYGASSTPEVNVNEVRRSLFGQRTQDLRLLPPTQDALLLHLKRAILQAGVWTSAHKPHIRPVVSPQDFGWKKAGEGWTPHWMMNPPIPKAATELVKCSCRLPCKVCKCVKLSMTCTGLCKCPCNRRLPN
jgi:hypothetical protein